MKRYIRSTTTQDMLDAFEYRLDELGASTDVGASTDCTDMLNAFEARLSDLKGVDSTTSVEAADEDGDRPVFMLMGYSSDPEAGIEGDNFDCLGKFLADSLDEAKADFDMIRVNYPELQDRDESYTSYYIDEYNDHFDDEDEPTFNSLEALVEDIHNGYDPDAYDYMYGEGEPFASTDVKCTTYCDPDGVLGQPGECYTHDDLVAYWESEHNSDPTLAQYDDMDSWIKDTLAWLTEQDEIESCGNVTASSLTSEQKDKLNEIADRYITSKPVSGDWNSERDHEQAAIAEEIGISMDEAKCAMIEELGFSEEDWA